MSAVIGLVPNIIATKKEPLSVKVPPFLLFKLNGDDLSCVIALAFDGDTIF